MDPWMKIGSAILLATMLVVLWPRAKHMVTESPKGSSDDWRTFIIVLVVIALFVFLLIKLV